MEVINPIQLTASTLAKLNADVSNELNGDCIFIWCGILSPLDDELRAVIEGLVASPDHKQNLIVLLETKGGYIEIVERMVRIMRNHYEEVYFIIAGHAYSAGTVLVLSGDRIYMDYYSVLGPIDPQVQDEEGASLLPGVGYLEKFKEIRKKINKSTSNSPNARRAELAYLIKRFDPAKLFHIEQAIQHGRSLITEWLPKYKFKSWKKTTTRGVKVDEQMRKKRAEDIASLLAKADRWHSHGRGISMSELQGEEIKLEIDDFGANSNLNSAVRNYHGLAIDYAKKVGIRGFIHTKIHGMRSIR